MASLDYHLGPAECFDGSEAHVGGVEPFTYIWFSVPLRTPKVRTTADEDSARLEAARARAIAQTAASLTAAGVKPKRSRRSKAEMAAVRARDAERLQRIRTAAEPEWLQERERDLDAFAASLREGNP